jgi:hypothetical protein
VGAGGGGFSVRDSKGLSVGNCKRHSIEIVKGLFIEVFKGLSVAKGLFFSFKMPDYKSCNFSSFSTGCMNRT